MEEGKSEAMDVASTQVEQICHDLQSFNRNPMKFVTGHTNAVKFWTFDNKNKKYIVHDCQLGKIKRFVNCISIDPTDTYVYCGTRTGDIMEIYVEKATFKRLGPLHRIFTNGIHGIVASNVSELIVGAGDGSIARIGKKDMKIA